MNKRQFLSSAAVLGASVTPAFGAKNAKPAACAAAPAILTVSGAVKHTNRGPLDPAFDPLMAKQLVKFTSACTFDYQSIASLPTVTIRPTIEYDAKQHTLSGPLLANVLEKAGVPSAGDTKVSLRAVDGYTVLTTLDNIRAWHFIVATQMDGKPMPLGGLGPLWAIYDADNIPELAAKPLKDRFVLCPWGLYQIQVSEA
ncbi:molybdopterin-dependent oxidoreductase [Paraburkholderia sp. Tr-20389]|uniref:molybdopterin-dependent oxidoreductase n=1 Tax=Paraburkholderia sp. Tr-20389 TaxID=2703903 RepID=UPI00197D7BC6|nr:molybdopterin-dependent oxidoreductase [Paraburkholderia sp. Tr-20389]MBN3753151.1 molybdopterin-dependent oxidoreductase [Paraburkholderia sp. Tr-20389]